MIRPLFTTEFVLATTSVHRKRDLSDESIIQLPAGCSLLLRGDQEKGWTYVATSQGSIAVDCKAQLKKIEGVYVNIAWVKDPFVVTVPVGIPGRAGRPGCWTTVTVKVDAEALVTSGASLPWREQKFGDLWINLLSEYYIDESDKQSGLSVFFRDRILSCLEEREFNVENLRTAAKNALAPLVTKSGVIEEDDLTIGEIKEAKAPSAAVNTDKGGDDE